jgi:hypothetical protein
MMLQNIGGQSRPKNDKDQHKAPILTDCRAAHLPKCAAKTLENRLKSTGLVIFYAAHFDCSGRFCDPYGRVKRRKMAV